MQRYVRRGAHDIISANLGEDVLALARCKKPDAIVLEVDMPNTIGWHTLRTLKADPEIGRIPVIVCSWQDEEARGLTGQTATAHADPVCRLWISAGNYPDKGPK
jgi:CheY-like chemotaxis protein